MHKLSEELEKRMESESKCVVKLGEYKKKKKEILQKRLKKKLK